MYFTGNFRGLNKETPVFNVSKVEKGARLQMVEGNNAKFSGYKKEALQERWRYSKGQNNLSQNGPQNPEPSSYEEKIFSLQEEQSVGAWVRKIEVPIRAVAGN